MTKPARRQHYIARFYLRNFAEPMFSDNLCVYDLQQCRWERRSPDGVGWFPHLCSMFDIDGKRTDDFDQFLKKQVEDPATPALKKLATGKSLDETERSAAAFFIALTSARSPEMMNDALTAHLDGLAPADRADLDRFVRLWCDWTGRIYDSKSQGEFLKPSSFGAIWFWSKSLQRRLLDWEWQLIRTTRDQPFVTSDRPVYMSREHGMHLVSFPVSSEFALVIIAGGQFNDERDRRKEALAMNRQTMAQAKEFVVGCKRDFPAGQFLTK